MHGIVAIHVHYRAMLAALLCLVVRTLVSCAVASEHEITVMAFNLKDWSVLSSSANVNPA